MTTALQPRLARPANAPTPLWTPFPGFQTRALAAGEFDVFMGGAKGPGKTDLLLIGAKRQTQFPLYKALLLRETYTELQEVIDRAHRLFGRLPTRERPVWNGAERRFRFPAGSSIEMGYGRTVEQLTRYQGGQYAYIGYDEYANVRDPRVGPTLVAEIRCPDPRVRRFFRGSGNPGKAGHAWIKRRYIDTCGRHGERVFWDVVDLPNGDRFPISRRFIPGTVYDNPIYANDPLYMAQLASLPERLRRQLLEGDWDAGTGAALDELHMGRHLVKRFEPPPHWPRVAAFDWGYAHRWVFTHGAVNEDGRIFVCDTISGHRQRDDQIFDTILERVPNVGPDLVVHAGHDVAHKQRAHTGDNTPTVQERALERGIVMALANIDRAKGLANLRHYLAWKGLGPNGSDGDPMLVWMDTPGNRKCVEQLESMVTDEDNPEDVLKVNADPETGDGGDDFYDTTRYLAASRPFVARSNAAQMTLGAWEPAVLAHERDRLMKRTGHPRAHTTLRGRLVEAAYGELT